MIDANQAILQKHGQFTIVRDDLLSEGGSKIRFLPTLIERSAKEVVFGGPFCGGAPLALAIVAHAMGKKCTLFYAKRLSLHWRQQRALAYGANLQWVPMGFIGVVQKRARDYAKQAGAQFLPLGFDLPAAEEPYVEAMENVRRRIGDPDEVWCVCASGMLTRCLGRAFRNSAVKAVVVGLASRHEKQNFSRNVSLIPHPITELAKPTRATCPFPSCANYDRKGWELAERQAKGTALFWNVGGDGPSMTRMENFGHAA